MSTLTIDPEFKALIPPLSAEEHAGLEASILAHGCRTPIDVWDDIVVDGHNRYAICTEHGIDFETKQITFEDRREATIWIIRNQFDRRNLTQADRMDLALLLKSEIQAQAQARMKAGKPVDPVANLPQGKTRDTIAKRAGVSGRTLDKHEKVRATGTPELQQAYDAGAVSVSAAAELAKLPEAEQVEAVKTPLPRVALNSGNFEWYTPAPIIEAAREAMGSIDTDPASCEIANATVKARQYFDIKADGLKQTWQGNVWMNPPYSAPLIGQFCEAVVSKYNDGEIAQAIVVCNNCTDTRWAHLLMSNATAVVFTLGRVKFFNEQMNEAKKNGPLQGQMFCYFGPNPEKFAAEFAQFGAVLAPLEGAA